MTKVFAAMDDLKLPPVESNQSGAWGHATGRIWCLEKNLMGRSGLERLYAASSAADVRRILLERRYPQKDTIEEIVAEESRELFELLREIAPEDGYRVALLLPQDGHNLKVLLKHSARGDDEEGAIEDKAIEHLFQTPALIEPETLVRALDGADRTVSMPDWIEPLVVRARESYADEYDWAAIDRSIDRDIAILRREVAKKLKDKWFSDYLAMERDFSNLEVLLRVKWRGLGETLYRISLLPGGFIDDKTWRSFYAMTTEELIDAFCGTPYKNFSSYFVSYGERGSHSKYIRDRDVVLLCHLRKGRKSLDGAPRVISYITERLFEFRNIRLVMATWDGLDPEIVQSLRRDTEAR